MPDAAVAAARAAASAASPTAPTADRTGTGRGVEKGRIQTIGVSNYSATQMREAHEILAKRGIPLAVNQVQYSLLSRKIETQNILFTAQDLGVTILAYSPLAQGLLTGKYKPEIAASLTGARRLDPLPLQTYSH